MVSSVFKHNLLLDGYSFNTINIQHVFQNIIGDPKRPVSHVKALNNVYWFISYHSEHTEAVENYLYKYASTYLLIIVKKKCFNPEQKTAFSNFKNQNCIVAKNAF